MNIFQIANLYRFIDRISPETPWWYRIHGSDKSELGLAMEISYFNSYIYHQKKQN